eukprot:scaffold14604_cov22-Cyclotella_meneghiniana.AAC.1
MDSATRKVGDSTNLLKGIAWSALNLVHEDSRFGLIAVEYCCFFIEFEAKVGCRWCGRVGCGYLLDYSDEVFVFGVACFESVCGYVCVPVSGYPGVDLVQILKVFDT